jgi:ABC-type glycerol-3-phosphate transport system permease component
MIVLIAIVLGVIGTLAVLGALAFALADLTLRTAEDFQALGVSRWVWRLVLPGSLVGGLAPFVISALAGTRDNKWLVAVPIAWIGTELTYLLTVRPKLQQLRPLPNRRVAGNSLLYAGLTLCAFILVFPLFVTIVNSLLTAADITSKPPSFFPFDPQWHSYATAWTDGHMAQYLKNSFVMTGMIVVGQVVTAILAGYAFAFLAFPGKRFLFVLFLGTLMIPFEVTIVTNLTTVTDLGIYNSYLGLALPFLATGFGAFLMRQSFLTLPRDLQDAARLDGYGHLRFMTRVAVPLVRPSVAALAVFAFFTGWNQYLWPFLITKDDQFRTVQIGVKQLRATQLDQLNVTFAGLVIAAIPLALLLILFQKQLIRGLTAGAVKG